jgi:NAD(P)-dependent dehydrogenase (short-subunit alcohol dehydrogenase family)
LPTVSHYKGKIALVTGANKGIVFEVARQLGAQDVTVFLDARNPHLGKVAEEKLRADGIDANFIELDVTKPEMVTRATEQLRARHNRLDILINNAGARGAGDGHSEYGRPDAVREALDINFFAILSVTQAMLLLVRKSGQA